MHCEDNGALQYTHTTYATSMEQSSKYIICVKSKTL